MIETFIKPVIYDKNHPGSAEQIAGGTYKNFDYYVLNLRTHPTAYVDVSDSPLNGICYNEIDIYCHGGLTYSESTLNTVGKKGVVYRLGLCTLWGLYGLWRYLPQQHVFK